jgi:hypothetical protein
MKVKGAMGAVGRLGNGADRCRLVALGLEDLTGGSEKLLGGGRGSLLALAQPLVPITPTLL